MTESVDSDTSGRNFLTYKQVAAELLVSVVTVRRYVAMGFLKAIRLGHRTARIRRGDLEMFLRRRATVK